MTRQVYLYVFDSVLDWEYGYLMAELKIGRYYKTNEFSLPVITVGVSRATVTTMGGLRVKPDITVAEMNVDGRDLLVLPKGRFSILRMNFTNAIKLSSISLLLTAVRDWI